LRARALRVENRSTHLLRKVMIRASHDVAWTCNTHCFECAATTWNQTETLAYNQCECLLFVFVFFNVISTAFTFFMFLLLLLFFPVPCHRMCISGIGSSHSGGYEIYFLPACDTGQSGWISLPEFEHKNFRMPNNAVVFVVFILSF
jgi:hypothetical protein